MSEKGEERHGHTVDALAEELRQEFRDEAADQVRELDVALDAARHGRMEDDALVGEVRRTGLRLKAHAANVGLRLVGTVAHRMEDYLANARTLPPRAYDDLQVFVDALLDILEGRIAWDSDAAAVVRRLPAKLGFDVGDIEVRNVEVMLVMLPGTATHFVERELHQCGYRVTTCASTFDALPMIVRTKPDMVIVSAVMPELTGIDLAAALATMPATRNTPIALITSLDPDDEYLKLLPDRVPVIHKGPSFGDDLAEALDRLFLI